MSIAFLVTSLIIVATPGTGMRKAFAATFVALSARLAVQPR